jgi:predicted nucleic acid-binding protein
VLAELQHPRTPAEVFRWASALPEWVGIQSPSYLDPAIDLGTGETEAISLALELKITAILIDERKGRLIAEQRGLIPVGTLNILYSAHLRGFLKFEESVQRLLRTSFHADPIQIQALVERIQGLDPS